MALFFRGIMAGAGSLAALAMVVPPPVRAADDAQMQLGARGFAQCAACHSLEPGKPNGVGPNLSGLFGKRAGTNARGYAYSDAMKKYGVIWSEKSLDAFLTSPTKAVPGTKMPYRGISDPAARAALVAYLKIKTAPARP